MTVAVVDCLTDVYSSVLPNPVNLCHLVEPPTHFHSHLIHSMCTHCVTECVHVSHMRSRGCYHVKQQWIMLIYNCGCNCFSVLQSLCINVLIVFTMPVAESGVECFVVPSFFAGLDPVRHFWDDLDNSGDDYCTYVYINWSVENRTVLATSQSGNRAVIPSLSSQMAPVHKSSSLKPLRKEPPQSSLRDITSTQKMANWWR